MLNVSRQNLNGQMRVTLLVILISLVCQSVSAQTVADNTDSGITSAEQAIFTKGQTLYNHGLYGEAIATLNELLTKYPSSTIKDLGLLWLGRCYLAQGDIANAEKVDLRLKDIPDTPLSSLYEDELRVARQAFVKMAAPKSEVTRDMVKNEVVATASNDVKAKPAEPSVEPGASAHVKTKQAEKAPPAVSAVTRDKKATNTFTKVGPKSASVPTTKSEPVVTQTVSLRSSANEAVRSVAIAETVPPLVSKTPTPEIAKKEIAPTVAPKPVAAITPTTNPLPIGKPIAKPITNRNGSAGTPLLRSQIKGIEGNNPNDRGVYRLIIVNEGDGRASDLTIRVELDLANDFLNSDLPVRQEMVGQRRILTFKLAALDAGETRDIVMTLRAPIVSGKGVLQHMVFYKDNQAKFLHTP